MWERYKTLGTPVEATIRASWQGETAVSLKGIDVSSFQPNTDWQQVAGAGYAFAFVKATEGTGYVNPQFARDWPATKAAGMVRGAYHFYEYGIDPAAQADHFLATVGALSPADLLALDIETGTGDLSGPARAFLDRCQQVAGVRPVLYSYTSFLPAHNLTAAATGASALWLADYRSQWPATPAGWAAIAIWQHTSQATVPGVQGQCDESYSPLTRDQLAALGYQGGQPAVDPAQAYYFQAGHTVNTTFALWTVALKPLYDFAAALKAAGNPMADLVMPGPLASGETPTTWGPDKRPASFAALTNRKVGVYQSADGAWHPYQLEL